MNYKMIVAICNGGGIGKSNALPWYSPKDLRHFSKLTRGEPPIDKDTGIQKMNVMVMGRNTWNSIPKKPLKNEAYLSFGKSKITNNSSLNLSPNGDLKEAAFNLFDFLRKLDKLNKARIAISSIPDIGIGKTINERLKRASHYE